MACRLGVDAIEVDVRRTSDGVLVVRHDSITDRHGRAMSYDELRRADPVILTLEEAVAVVAGRVPLLLDIKTHDSVEPLGRWLAGYSRADTLMVCSPQVEDLRWLASVAPRVARLVTFPDLGAGGSASVRRVWHTLGARRREGDFAQMSRDLIRALRDMRRERSAAIAELGGIPWRDALPEELPEAVRAAGASGITVHQWLVTPQLVEAAHQLGVTVTAWTVNRPDALAAVVRAGVDCITTDDVEGMRMHLGPIRLAVQREQQQVKRWNLRTLVKHVRRDGLPDAGAELGH